MPQGDDLMREWDQVAESFSTFVREGKDYYRDEVNNPAAFMLIGDVEGKLVLDLACGEGYNTRILAKKGAVVVGVDFSARMLEFAREKEMEEGLGITYHNSDVTAMMDIRSEYFDLATCFMALQDIENCEAAMSEVARVLKENGRFIFSIPHPCFIDHITKEGKRITGWLQEDGAEEQCLVIKDYFGIGEYEVQWDMNGIARPFKTTAFHRTLTDYFHALHANKLLVSGLVEPKATSKTIAKHPPLQKRLKIPQSIIIEAIKLR